MIIEFLGQPASGKSFITKEVEKTLKLMGVSTYVPEFIWLKKNKLQKFFVFLFWYVSNFGFLFNKNIRKPLLIIKKRFKGKKRFYYFYTFLLYMYFINLSKKHIDKDIILFSENVINFSGYLLRGNISEESVKLFTDIYKKQFKKTLQEIIFVYVRNDFDLVLQKKKERFTNISEEQKDYIEKDVKSNIELFNQLVEIKEINNKVLFLDNNYDEKLTSYIHELCELIISRFKEGNV